MVARELAQVLLPAQGLDRGEEDVGVVVPGRAGVLAQVGVGADAAEGGEGLVEDLFAVGDEEDAVEVAAVEGAEPGLAQAGGQDDEAGAVPGFPGGRELPQGIPPDRRAETGKALCIWGDAGWGRQVREGKYRDGHFGDDLVTACTDLANEWSPQPPPRWVTCIPSHRHPSLVPDFAKRLATRLGLPFIPVVQRATERPEQKRMENSVQQARNVDGAFSLKGRVPDGPVLLVDDMVDSGWTSAVAAWLLREHGSAEVWPLVLADTGRRQ